MNFISINVQEPYYSFILNGKKTVEGRLNKGKFASIIYFFKKFVICKFAGVHGMRPGIACGLLNCR
jgi:hypothetical protein